MKGSDTVKIQEVIDTVKKIASLIPEWKPEEDGLIRSYYEVELIKEGMEIQCAIIINKLERIKKAREEEVYE